MNRSLIVALGLGVCFAGASLGGGCARTLVSNPLVTDAAPDDYDAEAQFWDQLGMRTSVSNDEGLHGLFLTADQEDRFTGYDARVAEAKARAWLPRSFNEPANMAMQRGTLAVAVCKIARIRGGVSMMVLGPTQRYCTRELVYLGIMQGNSTDFMSFTGLEFIAVMGRMQDYMHAHPLAAGDAGSTKVRSQQSAPGSNQPASMNEPPPPDQDHRPEPEIPARPPATP